MFEIFRRRSNEEKKAEIFELRKRVEEWQQSPKTYWPGDTTHMPILINIKPNTKESIEAIQVGLVRRAYLCIDCVDNLLVSVNLGTVNNKVSGFRVIKNTESREMQTQTTLILTANEAISTDLLLPKFENALPIYPDFYAKARPKLIKEFLELIPDISAIPENELI